MKTLAGFTRKKAWWTTKVHSMDGLIQEPDQQIYGTAHNSVLQIPGRDEWYFVYHRINPNFIDRNLGPGFHRQVCIDRMEFNDDGTIRRGKPTQQGVRALK